MSEQALPGKRVDADLWAWFSLGAAIAALIAMFILSESPPYSIGLAIVGLVTARLARGARRNLRGVVILAVVLASLALAVHLVVGLAWSSATYSG